MLPKFFLCLRTQFSGIKSIHNVVQPAPPSISRTHSSLQTETVSVKHSLTFLCTTTRLLPSSWKPFYFLSL